MKYLPTTCRVTTTLFNKTSLSVIFSLNIDQKVHVVPHRQSWVYKIHKKVEVIPSTKFTLKAARKFTKILTGKTLICNSYSSLIKKCYTTKVTKQWWLTKIRCIRVSTLIAWDSSNKLITIIKSKTSITSIKMLIWQDQTLRRRSIIHKTHFPHLSRQETCLTPKKNISSTRKQLDQMEYNISLMLRTSILC